MPVMQAAAPPIGVDEASRRAILFPGRGEMAERCRAFDWAGTPLGPVADWSHSLCTIASTILASRHPMFLWWGPELVQIYNDAYRPSFGDGGRHPRALGARGREFWTDIWDIIGSEVDGVLASGEATWHVDQLVPIERNGAIENVWWTYGYSPVRDEGLIAGVLVVVQETTARVTALAERDGLLAAERGARADAEAAHEAAQRARVEAETANRSKSEFLAVMSHELRTPLNAIGGYAELIELGVRGPVTAEQRADLARIQQSQRHLLGLISGVLNYSRVEAGAVQYALADVSVLETMAVCEALTAPQVRARGLTFTFERCDPTLTVRADREKLQQVLLNLLTNAVKFTDPGGRIAIRCEAADDSVMMLVQDSGRGIASAKLEMVFEPFVQVDATLTRTSEGVGLGLAISRDLARGMSGDLTVTSVLGKGSTFSLRLPRVAMR